MRAGATFHVSPSFYWIDFFFWFVVFWVFGCWFGAVVCWSFAFSVNPVTGTLSLLWLWWNSKDCHCRHDERSNRSKKRARDLRGTQAAHSKKRHTEASQCPQLGFKGFKIQISINFTMRPSHDEGKIHLQKTLCGALRKLRTGDHGPSEDDI